MLTDEQKLAAVLAMADLTPPGADLEAAMLAAFRSAREQAALVFSVAEARYEEPSLVFSAKLDR